MPACIKCAKELPDGASFCPWCGSVQKRKRTAHKRSNGQGSVYQLPNGSWMAARVLAYEPTEDGKVKPVKVTKSGFRTKREALDYLPQMTKQPAKIDKRATFKDIYDLWLPTHEQKGKSKSTMNCYKAAMKYYESIWHLPFADLGIDDLQECVDDCPHGKRTRENMKALGTLLYAYAIPRGYVKVNLAHYLFVGGAPGAPREEFQAEEIETIRKSIDIIPYADYIYCQIYLGFRPHEFLMLDATDYDAKERCFTGGGKTTAGTGRKVTVSPKIQDIVSRLVAGKESGPVFCGPDGKALSDKFYREECFYPALEKMGLPNPQRGEHGPRKLTPHCCRHTFATLMKNIQAPDKDKLELMGHTSAEMLRHYQHTNYEDLRRITDYL